MSCSFALLTHLQLVTVPGLEQADHPPPTEDEQQHVAMFWAMEEANTPRGWDDQAELDYTVLSQRQTTQSTGASPESSGTCMLSA